VFKDVLQTAIDQHIPNVRYFEAQNHGNVPQEKTY